MSTDDESIFVSDVLYNSFDDHAMMLAEPGEISTVVRPDVTTLDGGAVSLNVGRTFYVSPIRPKWSISIVGEDIDGEDPDTAGHMCHCGDGPHEKGPEPCMQMLSLGPDAAVKLAREILRLAEPMCQSAQDD